MTRRLSVTVATLLAILSFSTPVVSQPGLPSQPEMGRDSSFHALLRAGGGWRSCAGYFSRYWEPYPFAGLTLDLPTTASWLFFRSSFDAGRITTRKPGTLSLFAMRVSFAGMVEKRLREPLRIRTGIGVTSATFSFDSTFSLDTRPFSTSESEFGLGAYGEIAWRIRRIELAVPLSLDAIFSLPRPLFYASASLLVGGVF